MTVLVLNGACVGDEDGNLVSLVGADGKCLALEKIQGRGGASLFPEAVSTLLGVIAPRTPAAIIAVRGPGSFSGLRASLALAKGLSMGWGCPLKGVSLGEALRSTLQRPEAVIFSLARQGYVFADFPSQAIVTLSFEGALERLSSETGFLAGDAVAGARKVPEILVRAQTLGIECAEKPFPTAEGIFKAGMSSSYGESWLPLYLDPPKISKPKAGLRPPPFEEA